MPDPSPDLVLMVPCPNPTPCAGRIACPVPSAERFSSKGAIVMTYLPIPPEGDYVRCPTCNEEVRGSVFFSHALSTGGQLSVDVTPHLTIVKGP